MRKYEYVSVDYSAASYMQPTQTHRKIIDGYADMGYRFVGVIPTQFSPHGAVVTADLIFEKEREAPY